LSKLDTEEKIIEIWIFSR